MSGFQGPVAAHPSGETVKAAIRLCGVRGSHPVVAGTHAEYICNTRSRSGSAGGRHFAPNSRKKDGATAHHYLYDRCVRRQTCLARVLRQRKPRLAADYQRYCGVDKNLSDERYIRSKTRFGMCPSSGDFTPESNGTKLIHRPCSCGLWHGWLTMKSNGSANSHRGLTFQTLRNAHDG